MPFYFRRLDVSGREHLPLEGPVILAPTHRSRWDALVLAYAAGQDISGRDMRFMVSANEITGIKGWFIRRLGGFPIDTQNPAIASLRHGIELLQQDEELVIFPEGWAPMPPQPTPNQPQQDWQDQIQPLKPGLARLALQAQAHHPDTSIKVVPLYIGYDRPQPTWRCRAMVHIGKPLEAAAYAKGSIKQRAQQLTNDLELSLKELLAAARR